MKLLICLGAIQVIWAANVDFFHERSVKKIQPASTISNSSLFGFSIAYDQTYKRLITSAPRENNIGEVYQCTLGSKTDCSKYVKNIERYANYNNDYWFGATVRAGSDFVIACAPRFTKEYYGIGRMYGHCYMSHEDGLGQFKNKLIPANLDDSKENIIEYTLGWSMDIGVDNSYIIGGPGITNKTGLAVISNNKDTELQLLSDIPASFNFGYSVAVVRFKNNVVHYAVSSPYGRNGQGNVYFYKYKEGILQLDDKMQILTDKHVGHMFGAVLCAAKLSHDIEGKLTDLLVGAPIYAVDKSYNVGAVYVYRHTSGTPQLQKIIQGTVDGSYFGSAIIAVGDINGDKREDVAIGAPFEDDGAVYIYSGASLVTVHQQEILLQKIKPTGYKSFGYSLAVLKDYDDNGCNELAVGAPDSNTVMLYSGLAAINITYIKVTFPDLQENRLRKTDFQFDVCIYVNYSVKPKTIIADIAVDVRMYHQYARLAHNKDRFTYHVSLNEKNESYCKKIDLLLPPGNYTMKLRYEISISLLNNPIESTHFDGSRVILSDSSMLTKTDTVSAIECKVGKCVPKLDMNIVYDMQNPFLIGSSENATFTIEIKNSGDPAPEPCVQFSVTSAVLMLTPTGCSKQIGLEESVICVSRLPLKTDDTWAIKDVILNLNVLNNQHETILFEAKLFERCSDKSNPKIFPKEIKLLTTDAKIVIKGTTAEGELVKMTKNAVLYEGKHLQHIYMISNKGKTDYTDIDIEVTMKKEYLKFSSSTNPVYIIKSSIDDVEKCVTSSSGTELKAQCNILTLPGSASNSVNLRETVKIIVETEVVASQTVYDALQAQKNLTVTSDLRLTSKGIDKYYRISTVIELNEIHVAWWILALAGLIGICILIILVMILQQCGVLERKNKKNLQELKREVYRQSVRRSMMQQRNHEDRKKVLEHMEEEDIVDNNPKTSTM